jgi:hypothetical protein
MERQTIPRFNRVVCDDPHTANTTQLMRQPTGRGVDQGHPDGYLRQVKIATAVFVAILAIFDE